MCVIPLQQYFSYIVAVSFIGGENRSTGRKPPTCLKTVSHSVVPRHQRDSKDINKP